MSFFIWSITEFGILAIKPNEPFHMEHYGIWDIGNKSLCESSAKRSIQYQIAEIYYHGKI